ncbi:MAG: ABC transporter ATP-binding protein/permease [Treponema sp.]|jgi:ATP-binding cassette subfamily B protein|nr:ABC transporter ATP-binding protein/permease [Treponema sp.]
MLKEFKPLFPYLRRYKKQYIFGFICLIVVDLAQMLIPQCIRIVVDLISSGDFTLRSVIYVCLAMIGLALAVSSGRFLWRYFIHGSSRRIEKELRDNLFDHLMTLSYDFYQKNKIGDLMARGTNDLNAIRQSIGMGLVALIDGTVMALAILVIMFVSDAKTAALSIIPLPFITILILLFGKALGRKFRKVQESYSSMSDIVQETFAGIRVVKSFVKEWWFIKKFSDTNDDYQTANMSLVKIFGIMFPLVSFLSGLTTLILLLVGGGRVIEGNMSAGELTALLSYLQMLIWPMLGAGFMVNMIQRGAVSMTRVNDILTTQPSILSAEKTLEPKSKTQNAIEIKNLSFKYNDDCEVLENINLEIASGSMIGILGRTGSGKSTLLKTLVRLVDPPDDTVYIKGIDVKLWDLKTLRQHFGMTPQDTYLFSGSVKNNIGYGVDDAPQELLEKAAHLSAIDKDLKSFNSGWETLIGERGLTLSGGQKQRVAISRALAREPEILVLDDALSAVDAETEKKILGRLLKERKGKTTILVSHRVSTLRHADTIVVLEKGCIAECGSPAELLKTGGFYAQMAQFQKLEQAEEES